MLTAAFVAEARVAVVAGAFLADFAAVDVAADAAIVSVAAACLPVEADAAAADDPISSLRIDVGLDGVFDDESMSSFAPSCVLRSAR